MDDDYCYNSSQKKRLKVKGDKKLKIQRRDVKKQDIVKKDIIKTFPPKLNR